jgi:hypothetical protein
VKVSVSSTPILEFPSDSARVPTLSARKNRFDRDGRHRKLCAAEFDEFENISFPEKLLALPDDDRDDDEFLESGRECPSAAYVLDSPGAYSSDADVLCVDTWFVWRHMTSAFAAAFVRPRPGANITNRPTKNSPPGCTTKGFSSTTAKHSIRPHDSFVSCVSWVRAQLVLCASTQARIEAARADERPHSVHPSTRTPRLANTADVCCRDTKSRRRSLDSTTLAPLRPTTSARLSTRAASRTCGDLRGWGWGLGDTERGGQSRRGEVSDVKHETYCALRGNEPTVFGTVVSSPADETGWSKKRDQADRDRVCGGTGKGHASWKSTYRDVTSADSTSRKSTRMFGMRVYSGRGVGVVRRFLNNAFFVARVVGLGKDSFRMSDA